MWCGGDVWGVTMCAWHSEDLELMMMEQDKYQPIGYVGSMSSGRWNHNEVILDAWNKPWAHSLPQIIKAIVIRPECNEAARALGRRIHRNFLAAYNLSEYDASTPPLLVYDARADEAPFSMYDPQFEPEQVILPVE